MDNVGNVPREKQRIGTGSAVLILPHVLAASALVRRKGRCVIRTETFAWNVCRIRIAKHPGNPFAIPPSINVCRVFRTPKETAFVKEVTNGATFLKMSIIVMTV